MLTVYACIRGSQDHPRGQQFARRTHRTQHMARVMAVGSSSQRMQRRSHEGKRHAGPRRRAGWCLGKPAHLQRVPSQQSYAGCASFKPAVCLKLVSQCHFCCRKDLGATWRLDGSSTALTNVFPGESSYRKKVV